MNTEPIVNPSISEGHERTLKARKNVIQTFSIKGGSIAINLLLVPMTIKYVNPTQYGLWLIISTLVGWFSLFDIGLANGLKNKLAGSLAMGQTKIARVYVSTTYAILSLIAVLIFVLFMIINPFLDWARILNVPPNTSNNEPGYINNIVLIVVGLFCLQFVSQIINTVLTANHAPAKSSLISFVGLLLSIIIIYILSISKAGALIDLVLVLAGVPILVQLIFSVVLYKKSYRALAPSFKSIDFAYAKGLLSIGGKFFFIQIGALLLFYTDEIIITQIFGPAEVTTFNVAYKLFSVIVMISTVVLTPFWSAFTDAYTKGDLEWIRATVNRLLRYWIVLIVITFVLFFASPFIYALWIGDAVTIPTSLRIAMCFYVIGHSLVNLYSSFLNGIGKMKMQLYLYIFFSAINIPLAIFLGRRLGLAGITLSNIIVFVVMGIVFSIQTNKILNKKAFGIWDM